MAREDYRDDLSTVDALNYPIIRDKETIYKRLKALRAILEPSNKQLKQSARTAYNCARKNAYIDAKSVHLPNVTEYQPHYDFVSAISDHEQTDEDPPDFLTSCLDGFATYQGRSSTPEQQQQQFICDFCGETNQTKEEDAVDGEDAEGAATMATIISQLNCPVTRLNRTIKAHSLNLTPAPNNSTNWNPPNAPTSTRRSAATLMSFTTNLILERTSMFATIQLTFNGLGAHPHRTDSGPAANSFLYWHGARGPTKINLNDVAYIPNMFTSLVSLLQGQDIHFDSGDNLVYKRLHDGTRSPICFTTRTGGHWALVLRTEDPSIGSTSLMVMAAKDLAQRRFRPSYERRPITQDATALHHIWGCISPEAVTHLHESVTGVQPPTGRAPNTVECDLCALLKMKQQISRRNEHEIPVDGPFQRVAFDLIELWSPSIHKNIYVVHFYCTWLKYNLVFVTLSKEKAVILPIIRKKFCDKQGITLELAPLYTPEANGAAERLGQTLII
ncbi:uncharacterized protein BDR25DRAFT_363434 [Lindgomyces ingoldianus]|uniref:Uncharacterized protein n=1 Tax=Lindgomyces ingoldianus TaxID=673940 RepID=A0ACB6Q7F1_9PLEO|nr:uncharacterized protein BDR25DRAFT_363434 [Lindgomyces ingoldianus]KAF2462899.1 hypothetical protein BDR25DRAFT_363434 [Lindgomyces ingoldianus]